MARWKSPKRKNLRFHGRWPSSIETQPYWSRMIASINTSKYGVQSSKRTATNHVVVFFYFGNIQYFYYSRYQFGICFFVTSVQISGRCSMSHPISLHILFVSILLLISHYMIMFQAFVFKGFVAILYTLSHFSTP